MSNNKENAFSLRKAGKSYNEIHRQLHIPKSTLSGWFSSVDWSDEIKMDLIGRTRPERQKRLDNSTKERGEKLKKLYLQAEQEAKEEFVVLKNNPLFIAALMLYWGVGDKATKYRVSLSNTDPSVLRLFSLFVERICGIEKRKIKSWVLAYPGTDHVKALEFWSRTLSIWPVNFTKTIEIQGKNTKKTLPYGACYVVISSAYLKIKIMAWIRLLAEELIKRNAGMV